MNEKKSFWTTLPGILTGIAAVITAVSGLIFGLYQAGVLGDITADLTVTISVEGNGTTSPSPGRHTYEKGDVVYITNQPDSGWEFDHWSGDYSGPSPTATFSVDSNIVIIAHFKSAVDIQITRIFYDGLVPRVESDEYVEITNLGTEPVDLTGWVLKDIDTGYPSFTFPSYVLEPGQSVRVYTNEIHPESGGFSFNYGRAIWNNESPDTAALYDDEGREVSRESY